MLEITINMSFILDNKISKSLHYMAQGLRHKISCFYSISFGHLLICLCTSALNTANINLYPALNFKTHVLYRIYFFTPSGKSTSQRLRLDLKSEEFILHLKASWLHVADDSTGRLQPEGQIWPAACVYMVLLN